MSCCLVRFFVRSTGKNLQFVFAECGFTIKCCGRTTNQTGGTPIKLIATLELAFFRDVNVSGIHLKPYEPCTLCHGIFVWLT